VFLRSRKLVGWLHFNRCCQIAPTNWLYLFYRNNILNELLSWKIKALSNLCFDFLCPDKLLCSLWFVNLNLKSPASSVVRFHLSYIYGMPVVCQTSSFVALNTRKHMGSFLHQLYRALCGHVFSTPQPYLGLIGKESELKP
jgi:hypothetical protein